MALELTDEFKATLLKDNETIRNVFTKTFKQLAYNRVDNELKFVKSVESKVFIDFTYNITCEIKSDEQGLDDLLIDFNYGTESKVSFKTIVICGQVLKNNLNILDSFITERILIIENAINYIDSVNSKIYSIGEIYNNHI
jgi:hypothetical protein